MCLAEFAASYSTCYNIKDDEVYNDELPDTDIVRVVLTFSRGMFFLNWL